MRIEALEGKISGYIRQARRRSTSAMYIAFGLLLITLVAALQYYTNNSINITILYVLAVGGISLLSNKLYGYILSIMGAVAMETIRLLAADETSFFLISCLNTILMATVLMLFVYLLYALAWAYARENESSMSDALTGLLNIRTFNEPLVMEIERCRRFKSPFSIAQIGCDNLSELRKKRGNAFGDGIIRLMAEGIRSTLRLTDVVARVHEDEFVLLLTETHTLAASLAMQKLEANLQEIITKHYPELTFSAGILSFAKCPYSAREVLDMAELAMYESRLVGNTIIRTKEASD